MICQNVILERTMRRYRRYNKSVYERNSVIIVIYYVMRVVLCEIEEEETGKQQSLVHD